MTTPAAEPTFEQALSRLAEIVEKLEGGDLPLEESLALFEEGVRLARRSQTTLDQAEQKLEELLAVGPEGQLRTQPLASKGG